MMPFAKTTRCLSIAVLGPALVGGVAAAGLPAEAPGAIRREIQAVIAEGHYPGVSILLIHEGKTVMREAHGVVNLQTREPFSTEQLCWLASTGKIFTGLLMAMLVDDGVLSFDDPIDRFFTEFADIRLRDGGRPANRVLLRHALSHTTGLPSDRWLTEHGMSRDAPELESYFRPKRAEDFIAACLELGLLAEPGTTFRYGRPIDLSTCVVERATGKTFVALMDERIIRPLGLARTTLRPSAREIALLAPLYQSTKADRFDPDPFGLEVARRQQVGLSTAGGGVFSTLDDVGRVMLVHRNRGFHDGRQLVRAETLRQLYEAQPGTGGRYGLAFQLMESAVNGHSRIVYHPGYSGPVAWIDFERDVVGILLMQSNTIDRGKHHQRIIDRIHAHVPVDRPSNH
jgi:CubicO group peptidase (beta-lactamase class C family)